MENQRSSIPQNNDIMSTEGSLNSDLDLSTTAATRNPESGQGGASYSGDMNTGGYGGSRNREGGSIQDTDDDSLSEDDGDLLNDEGEPDNEMDDQDEARAGY